MKFSLKIFIAFFAMTLFLTSCRTSDDPVTPTVNELDGLNKIKEVSNDTHVIELYSTSGTAKMGYNNLKIRIKNKSTNQYEKSATISWMPVMHMTSMSHSCPKSLVKKISTDGTLYEGYIVFQMAENASEYWDLKIDYQINGASYTATTGISVPLESKKTVTSFLGSDNSRYIVAYIEPRTPKVSVNDWVVGVWKMEDMMNFPVADGLTVKLDPRMPGMGNHSSPNNLDAKQVQAGGFYFGKLSLTMTGYWKLNLQLTKADGTVLKGEPVTEANPASSLYHEIEF